MEKFGFHKVTNNSGAGQPHITHVRPNPQQVPAPPSNHSMAKRDFVVDNSPNNKVALSNCIGVNPQDFSDIPNRSPVLVDGHYVYTIEKDDGVAPGSIGLAGHVRSWGKWSLGQTARVQPYNIFQSGSSKQYLNSIEIIIDFRSKSKANSNPISHDELVDIFMKNFENQILQPTQMMVMDFKGNIFSLLIDSVQVVDINQKDGLPSIQDSREMSTKGILFKQSDVIFYGAEGSVINISKPQNLQGKRLGFGSHKPRARKQLINPDFKLEDLGIGGLDSEFQEIFRRAFNSRILPPELAEKLQYKHCKGLLLYGPPGTGKTLIARKLSKMLNGNEPKIVNGPEMLNKYVGASEENIRNLFKDAEAEYKKKGDDSDLHVIIFDELDSVFKQRGSSKSDGTGVGDNVVNQLLAKMDGVDQLNNILIIGMTNRLDLIDNALLRPGRFELQIEIALPDEKGRKDILLIHTKSLKENNFLAKDVDFDELSILTKNFTGAELEGLCNSAKSFALSRHTKSGTVAQIDYDSINNFIISRNDFLLALNEVKPAFGTDEEDLTLAAPHGIVEYSPRIKQIFDRGQSFIDEVRTSETDSLVSVLLHGPSGSGKTAIASTLALNSDFPFIKMLSAESVVGMGELQKILFIDNFFRDVYKSSLSVVVLDKIETLINYVAIGPRFSNDILQVLKVYLTKKPPKNRRLLILVTTSLYSVLKNMDLEDCFNNTIAVPSITKAEEVGKILTKIGYMTENGEHKLIVEQLSRYDINIGVKKLFQVLMNSKYLRSTPEEVVENIIEAHSS
jgi:vesicle-fusing ATPase